MDLLLLVAVVVGPFLACLAMPGWRSLGVWIATCAIGLVVLFQWIGTEENFPAAIFLSWSALGLVVGSMFCALKLREWSRPRHR